MINFLIALIFLPMTIFSQEENFLNSRYEGLGFSEQSNQAFVNEIKNIYKKNEGKYPPELKVNQSLRDYFNSKTLTTNPTNISYLNLNKLWICSKDKNIANDIIKNKASNFYEYLTKERVSKIDRSFFYYEQEFHDFFTDSISAGEVKFSSKYKLIQISNNSYVNFPYLAKHPFFGMWLTDWLNGYDGDHILGMRFLNAKTLIEEFSSPFVPLNEGEWRTTESSRFPGNFIESYAACKSLNNTEAYYFLANKYLDNIEKIKTRWLEKYNVDISQKLGISWKQSIDRTNKLIKFIKGNYNGNLKEGSFEITLRSLVNYFTSNILEVFKKLDYSDYLKDNVPEVKEWFIPERYIVEDIIEFDQNNLSPTNK